MERSTTDRVADLPAGRVHYREHGPADGRPVVFVHGFLVDHTLWSDVPQRLGERGFRAIAATWPLGSHNTAMDAETEMSPRGVARIVLQLLEELGLDDVVLVGNDTGGAVCQFVLDEDPSRIGRLVLTNCDAFDVFPPFPFDLLFRAGRHPTLARALLAPMRAGWLRNSPVGFGLLSRRRMGSESKQWVLPYLTDEAVRRDVTHFLRAWRAADLADVATRLSSYRRPVLLCWAPADRFFKIALGRRLEQTFPDARLVEMPGARTFVSLDRPAELADEIAAFANAGANGSA